MSKRKRRLRGIEVARQEEWYLETYGPTEGEGFNHTASGIAPSSAPWRCYLDITGATKTWPTGEKANGVGAACANTRFTQPAYQF